MIPDKTTVTKICENRLDSRPEYVRRFTNGICHYVYDVITVDKQRIVIRIANESTKNLLKGGIYWNLELSKAGIPVPQLLHYDLNSEFPYMILERLPGTDIGNIYHDLTHSQKIEIANEVISAQKSVSKLGTRGKYGLALSYDDLEANGKDSWYEVLLENLKRSREWASGSSLIPPRIFDESEELFESLAPVFDEVEAIPFLDDATTKNLIIHNGSFVGIVDTDQVCFGDNLRPIALTEMSLLASKLPTDYTTHLKQQSNPSGDWETRYQLYLIDFCVNFLAETALPFNGNNPKFNNQDYIDTMVPVFDCIIAKLKKANSEPATRTFGD